MANLIKSEVKSLSSVERELSIVVEAEAVKREVNQTYQRLSNQVRLKGFRPGKVPRTVLEHYYKGDVEKEVLNKLVNIGYQEAIGEHNLDPVADPQVKVESFKLNEDFTFTAKVEVRPEVNVGFWDGLELTVPELKLSEEAVDAEIEAMRDANATIVPVADRDIIHQGDMVECSFSGTIDGHHSKELSGVNHLIEIGAGQFFAEAEQALVGRKLGETVTATVKLPEQAPEAMRGKEATLTMAPSAIKAKQKPALDDEFAKDISESFNTLEDLRKAIRDEMATAKAARETELRENAAIEELVKQNPFDIPQSLVQRQAEQQAQRALAYIPREKAEAFWKEHSAALTEDAKPAAIKTVRATLLCDAIAKAQNIQVEESEVESEFAREAARNKVSVHKLRSYYNAEDIEAMRRRIAAGKALKLVIDRAHVKVVQGQSDNA